MSGRLPPDDDLQTSLEVGVPRREVAHLSDGRSIAFAQAGAGPDCLLIHGTLMLLDDMWLGPTPLLSQRLRVTAVDRPGHGLSARRRLVDASPWTQAAILHEFAQSRGLRRPVVVGHSFGGTVALAYAALYPDEVVGVVALAPPCLPELRLELPLFGPRGVPGIGEWQAPVAGRTSDLLLLPLLWQAIFLPQAMPDTFAERFPFDLAARPASMVVEGENAVALDPALARLAMAYHRCRTPTRIFGGTADIVVNNAVQGRIAAGLMPDASFEWVAGCGHMIHHVAPERVCDAVLALL